MSLTRRKLGWRVRQFTLVSLNTRSRSWAWPKTYRRAGGCGARGLKEPGGLLLVCRENTLLAKCGATDRGEQSRAGMSVLRRPSFVEQRKPLCRPRRRARASESARGRCLFCECAHVKPGRQHRLAATLSSHSASPQLSQWLELPFHCAQPHAGRGEMHWAEVARGSGAERQCRATPAGQDFMLSIFDTNRRS